MAATAVVAGLSGCQAGFVPAKLADATPEEVTRVTAENAKRLFRL